MAVVHGARLGHNKFGYDEELIRLPEHVKLTKEDLRCHSINETHKFRPESKYDNVETVNKNLFLIYSRYLNCDPDILRDMMVTFTQREFEYISTISEVYQCTPPVCNLGVWLLQIAKVDCRGNELVPFLLSLMCNIHTTTIYKNGYLSTVEDRYSQTQEQAIENSEIVLAFGGRNFYMEMVPHDEAKLAHIQETISQRYIHTDLFQWFSALGPEAITRSKRRPEIPDEVKPKQKQKKRKRRARKPRKAVTSKTLQTEPKSPKPKPQPKPTTPLRRSARSRGDPPQTYPKKQQADQTPKRKRRSTKIYTCNAPGCDFVTTNLRTFNTHCRSKHRNIKYTCEQCGKAFMLPSTLKRHTYEHQTKQFYCKKCGKTFRFSSELSAHKAEHNKSKRFKCKICGLRYQLENGLVRHMAKHQSKKWRCEYCDYKTNERRLLRLHKLSHAPPSIKCDACDLLFRYPNQLKRHLKKSHQ